MQLYLAVTPQEVRPASRYTHSFAHIAYRIGPDSVLFRQNLLLNTTGGLMSVSDRDAPQIDSAEKLSAAVIRECLRRNYSGVLLDFEEPPTSDRKALIQKLTELFPQKQLTLYVPECYAVSGASVLINTTVSGGNFLTYLKDMQKRYGNSSVLDVQRLAMDFTLPAYSGAGRPLSQENLSKILEKESPCVFFSPDLCARYFTFTADGTTHFILYDDADTLMSKLRAGGTLGFRSAFLMYPEVKDLLGKIFG